MYKIGDDSDEAMKKTSCNILTIFPALSTKDYCFIAMKERNTSDFSATCSWKERKWWPSSLMLQVQVTKYSVHLALL